MWNFCITLFLVLVRFLFCSRTWLWCCCGNWVLVLCFRERIAGRKCAYARLQAVRSGLLRQLGWHKPLNRGCNVFTSQYSHSHVENLYYVFLCLCVFCFACAPDCDVNPVFGCWFYLFGNGLQYVSVIRHARNLLDLGCCVTLPT